MQRFGEKLRTLRERERLTGRELAERLGCSQAFVVFLERGKNQPTAEMILKIADLFGVRMDTLMRDEREVG